MGKQRRSFTPEFKQEAVDLCRRSGKSACQVARGTSLRLHGWLERSGWIYSIRKGAGSSILAFEFF